MPEVFRREMLGDLHEFDASADREQIGSASGDLTWPAC